MTNPLTWGVLGCANIARRSFLPALAQAGGKLGAMSSRDLAKAQAWAAEFGAVKAYGSYTDLLADESIDAVYIPLPNTEHVPWAIKAAAAGKHVFCEKPFAPTAAEARQAVSACRKADVYLFEAFVYRCHPQSLTIARLIKEGKIGEVRSVSSYFHFNLRVRNQDNIRMRADLAGGALMDVGCYPLSYIRFIFGDMPIAVTAQAAVDASSGVDTNMVAALRFTNGMASASASMDALGGQGAVIFGSEGVMNIASPCHPAAVASVVISHGSNREESQFGSDRLPFSGAIMHFTDVVRGEVQPLVLPEEVIANATVVEAVAKAFRTGKEVELGKDA
jgi:predicted dehydrogenase